jgi:hypothetical protein
MKRDMDLCREVLRRLEEHPEPENYFPLNIDNRSDEEVSYHVRLLHQAGLIDGENTTSRDGFGWHAFNLTWEGHEFLEAARDDGLWKKAKDTTLSKGGGLTLDVLKAVLVELAKRAALGAITQSRSPCTPPSPPRRATPSSPAHAGCRCRT